MTLNLGASSKPPACKKVETFHQDHLHRKDSDSEANYARS